MTPIWVITIAFWTVFLILVAVGEIGFYADLHTIWDAHKKREEKLSPNESFQKMLDNLPENDCEFGKMMLKESRDNLDFSLDLRNQENQANLSMTAIIVALVTAGAYLGKNLFDIADTDVIVLYGSLTALLFVCILMSAFSLLASFSTSYYIPDPKDNKVRRYIESASNDIEELTRQIRNYLITLNGAKAEWNNASNRLKVNLGDLSRKYIKASVVFLLLMLITWSAYKLYIHSIMCCCC